MDESSRIIAHLCGSDEGSRHKVELADKWLSSTKKKLLPAVLAPPSFLVSHVDNVLENLGEFRNTTLRPRKDSDLTNSIDNYQ